MANGQTIGKLALAAATRFDFEQVNKSSGNSMRFLLISNASA